MSVENHIRLFDRIAKPYGLFYGFMRKQYSRILDSHLAHLGVEVRARVLDVGCGPGSMASAFSTAGFSVVGVDGSPRMAALAEANGIQCQVADATDRLPFSDNSFELVTAASVAHGFQNPARMRLFREMKRVAAEVVLLHDFSPAEVGFRPFSFIGFLERLEGSDYVAFRRGGTAELQTVFDTVSVFPVNKNSSWYLCR